MFPGPVTTLPQWDQAGTSQLHCYNNGIAVNAANNQANEEPLSHDSALKSEQGSGKIREQLARIIKIM